MNRSICLMLLSWTLACAPTQVYTRPIDDETLGQAKTFAFRPTEDAPSGYRRTRLSDEVRSIVDAKATELLEARGWRAAAPDRADLVVRVGVGARAVGAVAAAKLDAIGGQVTVVDPDGPFNYTEGSLVIDIFDGRTGRRVWHGSAFELIHVGRVDRGRIRRAVERVLSTFPPQATASR
jgi:hypothetical protein